MSFGYRVLALIAFLVLLSVIDLMARQGPATRWRSSLFLLVAACTGAVFGVMVDLVTSSISPAYFIVGKDLSPDWFYGQVCILGLQAGAVAGVLVGCVLLRAHYGVSRSPSSIAGMVYELRYPMVVALAGASAMALVAQPLPISWLGSYQTQLSVAEERQFLVVWCAHAGLYLGGIVGSFLGFIRVRAAARIVEAAERAVATSRSGSPVRSSAP